MQTRMSQKLLLWTLVGSLMALAVMMAAGYAIYARGPDLAAEEGLAVAVRRLWLLQAVTAVVLVAAAGISVTIGLRRPSPVMSTSRPGTRGAVPARRTTRTHAAVPDRAG